MINAEEPLEKKKVVESEDEKPSDSPKKPLMMMGASKPKGLPKSGPKPGGIGGMAGPSKSGGIGNLISKCLEKQGPPPKQLPQTFEELKDADAPLEVKKTKAEKEEKPVESPKKASLMLAKKPGKNIAALISKQLDKPVV